jgi:hypothetical protein
VVFWPTLYRYDTLNTGGGSVLLRTHRLTGVTERFQGHLGGHLKPAINRHLKTGN